MFINPSWCKQNFAKIGEVNLPRDKYPHHKELRLSNIFARNFDKICNSIFDDILIC